MGSDLEFVKERNLYYKDSMDILIQNLKNVTGDEFIEKTQKLHDEVISKAKGFISREHYVQDNTWTDFVLWESEEDANKEFQRLDAKEIAI